jgi:hypothetical protein
MVVDWLMSFLPEFFLVAAGLACGFLALGAQGAIANWSREYAPHDKLRVLRRNGRGWRIALHWLAYALTIPGAEGRPACRTQLQID